jgi:hypothetical protein
MKLIRQMNRMSLRHQMNLPAQSSLSDLSVETTPTPTAKAETVTTEMTSHTVEPRRRRTAKMGSPYDDLVVHARNVERTVIDHQLIIDDVEFDMDELIRVLVEYDDHIMTNAKEITVLRKYGIVDHPGHIGVGSCITAGPNMDDFLTNLLKMRRELDGEEHIP